MNFSKLTTSDIMNRKKTKKLIQKSSNIVDMDEKQFNRQKSELKTNKNLRLSFAIQENKKKKANEDRIRPFDNQESKDDIDSSLDESSMK